MKRFRPIWTLAMAVLVVLALTVPQVKAANAPFVTGGGFIDLGKSPTLLAFMGFDYLNESIDSEFGKVNFNLRLECEDTGKPNKLKVKDDDDEAVLVDGAHECTSSEGDGEVDQLSGFGDFECDGAPALGSYEATDEAPLPDPEPTDCCYDGPLDLPSSVDEEEEAEDMVSFSITGPNCEISAEGELDGGNITFHQAKGKGKK